MIAEEAHTLGMRAERLGERALILRDLPIAPHVAADALMEVAGVQEAVASYETVGVYFYDRVRSVQEVTSTLSDALSLVQTVDEGGVLRTIPVCYEFGEDLRVTAEQLDLPEDEVISVHLSVEYLCFAVGFAPGFGYLGYLPEAIAGVGRLDTPRTRVEPGSVAITGRQTAVYPQATPGGWRMIGRTPLTMVDVEDDYFPLSAGDRVRFTRIDAREFERLRGERL